MLLVLYIALGYVTVFWVLARLVVPHFGFTKKSLPSRLPESFSEIIEQINAESKDAFEFLKKSYDFITSRYQGSRMKTVTNFWVAFENPLNHKPGFMPCTGQNYLLRVMLIESGRFKDSDIELRVVPLNLCIHQYLRVKVAGKIIDVDPWSAFLGVPFGKKSAFIG